ncbi:hypothetical protein PLICRDRAFT_41601 [Plicaturopsis crispa FD-325 SS-3]|nr:hypothetical protein PLICRDRAFT_41601 [Plicaturopsis crispa FD-325 SS-3]
MQSSAPADGFAPVSKLPFEMLSRIFEQGALDCSPNRTPFFRSSYPLTLSRVTSYWRAVAIGTPSLWSCIDMEWMSDFLVALYLERSKGWTLDIHDVPLNQPGSRPRPHVFMTTDIHRWRSLHILRENGWSLHRTLRNIVHTKAPSLENLSLAVAHVDLSAPIGPRLGDGLPRLTYLRLEGLFPGELVLAWFRSITILHFSAIHYITSYGEFQHMLESFPSLKKLVLQDCICEPMETPPSKIELASLETVIVRGTIGRTVLIKTILQLFRAPRLANLMLSSVKGDVYSHVLCTIATFFPSLRSIKVGGFPSMRDLGTTHAASLVSGFVQRTPYIEDVDVCVGSGPNGIHLLNVLATTSLPDPSTSWPHLRTLTISSPSPTYMRSLFEVDPFSLVACLTNFLDMRARIGLPIQTLRIHSRDLACFPPAGAAALHTRVRVDAFTTTPQWTEVFGADGLEC